MESINEKIKNLLVLAGDTSDEESQTALLMAQKMMLKHGINKDDINIEETSSNVVHESVLEGKYSNWVNELLGVIALIFDVNPITIQTGTLLLLC
ncbi:DUF2786 domain-containing protein [Peribacillus muralis]|uniref:DUF2786 domain-containing protein n=1 Tax=Peribacillus muralis TaxID=264697 RepID=UPI003D08D572